MGYKRSQVRNLPPRFFPKRLMPKIQKICVIGDGGWGTTLAVHLARKKYPVNLWGPFPDYVRELGKKRINEKFLPGIRLPDNVRCIEDLTKAIDNCQLIIFAIPSKY